MSRAIDADKLMHKIGLIPLEYEHRPAINLFYKMIEEMPTLTSPNEPLTLISMSDELPPDDERVLVYRPCMADSDIGPYSVQWGWFAKKDGSHWAHLPKKGETL